MKEENGTAPIKPYTVKQLAEFYSVSEKTFRTWLDDYTEELGVKKGHYYNVRQVKVIFENVGCPKVKS
jgi:hypothetical protein